MRHRQGEIETADSMQFDDQSGPPSGPSFLALGWIVALRQSNVVKIHDRQACQQRVSLHPETVLSRSGSLVADAFGEFEKRRGKYGAHAQTIRDLEGDVAIPGSRHPIVRLVQGEHVGRLKRFRFKTLIEEGPAFALFDVPMHEPDKIPMARLRSEEHTSELQSLRHLVCRL